ncbi:TonB-dependent receptor, partial [Flavobacterium sp. UBA7682]|uniref:TonB-dependent receptor n=1 Tax=Flavobacterium sp. UBA7682 TaxID=1946560 RepID=UPI0025BE7B94
MKKFYLTLIAVLLSSFVKAQTLSQTIRGTIVDADSKLPIEGAVLLVKDISPSIIAETDSKGNFRLEKVRIGRVNIQVSATHYLTAIIPNIEVNSAKEVILNLEMQETSIKMAELTVQAYKNKGEARNDMSLVSGRSISTDETSRFAGGFNDPSRIMSNFAGVTSTQDGGNDIIVRGNSPKYVQWRLEGMQITNPNHFANQGAAGGGISALNNNLLATSDFYTGAFSPEYGDALSGVYDVKMRSGNNEKLETTFGLGILGADLTVEGPFKKGYKGSYLANYRYSTAGLASNLGLMDISGTPKFQDGAFKI